MGGGGGLRRAGCRCWYLLSSDSSSTSVSSISGMLWMRSLMRNSGWAMKLWMELRDSGFSRPSYSELRNAFTTRICPKVDETETTRKREEKVRRSRKGGDRNKGDPETVCPPSDKQSDRQRHSGQVAAVTSNAHTDVSVHSVYFRFD